MINNTVIEVLDLEHGTRVIKYFKSLGVDTKFYDGACTKKDNNTCRYYGVIDGVFSNHSYNDCKKYNATIIELPNSSKTMKTTRRALFSIWNQDSCTEFNQEIQKVLAESYMYKDEEKFNVPESSLKRLPECTKNQLELLKSIGIEKPETIDYSKLKTGSRVIIKETDRYCSGLAEINIGEPVDIIFYKTPHYINNKGEFISKGAHSVYTTFHQNGKYILFSADKTIDYITKVLEY